MILCIYQSCLAVQCTYPRRDAEVLRFGIKVQISTMNEHNLSQSDHAEDSRLFGSLSTAAASNSIVVRGGIMYTADSESMSSSHCATAPARGEY
jgi:hypothetical protein